MNSVRPLVTITILAVVGAYLYVKINQGPARPHGPVDQWQNDDAGAVPPLDALAGQTTATDAAPPWPTTPHAAATAAPAPTSRDPIVAAPAAIATADDSLSIAAMPQTLPAVPVIPALPDVSTPVGVTEPAPITSVPPSVELPADIPTARYPDQPGAPPAATNSAAAAANSGNEFPIPSAASSPSPPEQNPLRQTNQSIDNGPTANADPYSGVYGQNATSPASSAPVEPAFAASWPEIQSALERGQLSQAHQMLSKWYGDPSLTPAEAETVESLLGQLAGTVVYSTEHELEPARVVKPGETLETIASEYNVPWQLLAKINGIASPDALRPGQELKVVRGPFSAIINLDRKQLTLMLGDRYAGAFQVAMPGSAAVNEGQWIVEGKPESTPAASIYGAAPTGTASREILLKSADSTGAFAANPLMIGSRSADAAGAVPYITVSPTDAEELADILSVGSPIVIRR